MAARSIPNLTPAVFLSPTAQLEVVQDGVTYRASAAQIAQLSTGIGGIKISNDISEVSITYPIFSKKTDSDVQTIYSSDPYYNYTPSEGRLSVLRPEATQGIVFNNSRVSMEYTFPAYDNATSCGPLTISAAITVPVDSEWMII